MRRPNACVLGGSGFLGVNLCSRLVSLGYRVRAFGRGRTIFPHLAEVEWYQGDFANASTVARVIESFDVVYHLVNSTTPYSANIDMIADVQENLVPSLALFEAASKLSVRRIIFVSSGGAIYGNHPRLIPTPETASTDPINAHGVTKLAIEKYLAVYERASGLDYRVLRVTNPFGPFQQPLKRQGVIGAFILQALQGRPVEIWGDGSLVRDFIYIEDVVDALVATAADDSEHRVFNIGSGRGRNLRDVIATLERALDTQIAVEWKPGRLADTAVSTVSIDRAREVLGWSPKTSFEEGIEQTVAWWKRRSQSGLSIDGAP